MREREEKERLENEFVERLFAKNVSNDTNSLSLEYAEHIYKA